MAFVETAARERVGKPWHSWAMRAVIFLGGAHIPLLLLATWGNPRDRAIILMATGLYVLWCVGAMALMWRYRDAVRARFHQLRGPIWLKFFLFALALLLIEEAVTTTMTNLAPVFGSRIGEAYITGSANYLEVVLWHSVSALMPSFLAWAVVIRKVAIHPNTAFLFYGFQGVLAEVMYSGPQQFVALFFWTAVYGPMIYLPAYCVYGTGEALRPKARHFVAIYLLGILFTAPVAATVTLLRPKDAGFPEVIERTTPEFLKDKR